MYEPNPNRKPRKGKPFGGFPIMSPEDFKKESMRLRKEAEGRDNKPILYRPTGDPNDVRISMGDPAIKTVPWTNYNFPDLTQDTIALLKSLNQPSRKPPTGLQAQVNGSDVLEHPSGTTQSTITHPPTTGVDGVKVDVQCILETLGTGLGGRVTLTRQYHQALDASVTRNFPDNGCIACMSLNADALYCSQQTAVVRASDDFYPRDPVSHTIHFASVAGRKCANFFCCCIWGLQHVFLG